MADYCAELRNLAAIMKRAKEEIYLERQRCTKPRLLSISARCSAVQAARVVAAAVDLGFSDIWPGGEHTLSEIRGRDPKGLLRDDAALILWINFICPMMRSKSSSPHADHDAFDIPEVKIDDQGRILGLDGKPVTRVKIIDPETGKSVGWELSGSAATVINSYDEAAHLQNLRHQAENWVEACGVAAAMILTESKAKMPSHT